MKYNSEMKQLLLMRHAKSDWHSDIDSDYDRPLTERGQRNVPRVAAWLKNKEIVPDYIFSSPAKRAKETTKILCKEMGLSKKIIHWQASLYGAGFKDCLDIVNAEIDRAETLLLVGHNPALDELVSYLSSEPPPRSLTGKLMTTSALAVFNVADKVLPNHLDLEYLIRPKEI